MAGIGGRIPGGIAARHQPLWALAATPAIFFGANAGYYAFSQMSHESTFLFATLFLFIWWRVRESGRPRDSLLLGVAGGFLSICRWQDCLYLAGPLMFDLWGARILQLGRAQWWRSRLPYASGVLIWWIPQIWKWKMIDGKFLTIPQGGGIFLFLQPTCSRCSSRLKRDGSSGRLSRCSAPSALCSAPAQG